MSKKNRNKKTTITPKLQKVDGKNATHVCFDEELIPFYVIEKAGIKLSYLTDVENNNHAVIMFNTIQEVFSMLASIYDEESSIQYSIKEYYKIPESSIWYKDIADEVITEDIKTDPAWKSNYNKLLVSYMYSPEKIKDMNTNILIKSLIDNNLVASLNDVNMLIIESIQNALIEDDEFPIHYYSKDEKMPETNRMVNPGDCLTDEYIENNMI